MSEYRTECIIPPDRYVCLQLPADLPEGRATVTVTVHEPAPEDPAATREVPSGPERDPEHEDIEWWEEFDIS